MAQQFNPLIKHGFQKFDDYSLPVAGADTLGGVKVGTGLSIDENGVLSSDGGGGGGGVSFYVVDVSLETEESVTFSDVFACIIGKCLFFQTYCYFEQSFNTDTVFRFSVHDNPSINIQFLDSYRCSYSEIPAGGDFSLYATRNSNGITANDYMESGWYQISLMGLVNLVSA